MDKTGVRPVTIVTAPLVPGQSAWVSVVWTADQTVDDWSTTRDRAGSPALVAQLRTVSSAGCPAA